jgi:hypothetical protein
MKKLRTAMVQRTDLTDPGPFLQAIEYQSRRAQLPRAAREPKETLSRAENLTPSGTAMPKNTLFFFLCAGALSCGPAEEPMTLGVQESAINGPILDLGFQNPCWTVFADSPWWAQVDMRNMLDLFHPVRVSRADATAGASCMVTIPTSISGPFALRYYADTYFGWGGSAYDVPVGRTVSLDDQSGKVVITNTLLCL